MTKRILSTVALLLFFGAAGLVLRSASRDGEDRPSFEKDDASGTGKEGSWNAGSAAEAVARPPGTVTGESGPSDLLSGLDSPESSAGAAAIDRLASLPKSRLIDALREGMKSKSALLALACAWLLDWKFLDREELDMKVELLTPYCRSMNTPPIEGLAGLLREDDEHDPMERFRHAIGFRNATGLLSGFPKPPASGEDTGPVVLTDGHKGMNASHIPLLIAIAEREGDPRAAEAAFSTAILLQMYSRAHLAETAEMVWRLNPCAARAEETGSEFGFQRRPDNLHAAREGLPRVFIDLALHYCFCSACLDSAGFGGIRRLLESWARDLLPCKDDLPLITRFAEEYAGYLRLWAISRIPKAAPGSGEAAPVLRRISAAKDDDAARAMALHALASTGEAQALDMLAGAAGEGDELALALLADLSTRPGEVVQGFIENSGDCEEAIALAMLLPGLFGIQPEESWLESIGRMLIERPSRPEVLLGFHEMLGSELRKEAAAKALKDVWKMPWPGEDEDLAVLKEKVFPFIEAWAPEEFGAFLRHRAERGDENGRRTAADLLKLIDSPPDFKAAAARRGNIELLRQDLADRSRGRYWQALNSIALTGPEIENKLFKEALEGGHFGVWNEDEGVFLGSRLWSIDFLLEAAESNCCIVVYVRDAFLMLFGPSFGKLEAAAEDDFGVFTPAELMKIWHSRLYSGSTHFSRIGGRYLPGVE